MPIDKPILLVVDDRQDNLFVIEQLIEEYIPQCKVKTALSAEVALKSISTELPDGILSDIQMPGMNGIEFCQRIKDNPDTCHVPFLLMTAHNAEANLRIKGLDAGADDFIEKPIDNLELATRIRVMFRIKYYQDELRNAKNSLEKKVQERTTDLEREHKEKIELQKRLGQAQKMEAIGSLAGGIAHDFNNILGVIIGYADIAQEDAPPDTQCRQDLDKVLSAASRAKDLVKQILAFSRQSQTERFPLQIQPLLKESLKMVRASIPSTIRITTNIDPDCGIIEADPTQIHQVLMNLCTNAYHAMELKGGNLSVMLQAVRVGCDNKEIFGHVEPGEYLELSVQDTGIGIEQDVIDKIFDPYFTTKKVGKGTGMGLSIIHGIMQDYNGTITVKSTPDKGSTFRLYFPVIELEAIVESKKSEPIQGGTERILFIDDEDFLAEMGQEMLERLGYKVTSTCSSLNALDIFQKNPDDFDLVITDQTMPDMTGSDLAQRMMQTRPDIPIILCTGYSNLIDEESTKAIGIKEFALKPLTKKGLAKLIRKVLNGNS